MKKKKNTSQAKQFDTIDKRSNVKKTKTLKNNLEQFGRAKHSAFFQS